MRKIAVTIFAVLWLFSVWGAADTEEELVLTLKDTIRLALEQNPYHLAVGERVAQAKTQVREAAAGFFPNITAQGLHTLDEKLFFLEFPSLIPGQPAERVEIDFTRDYQFSLSMTVPLFTSGGLRSGFKSAQYGFLASKEAQARSRHETVFNAKQAFYGYLLAEQFVKVAEEAVEVAEKHFENVTSMYKVGMASKFDLLRSEVQLANLKPQLISSRNVFKVTELRMKTLLGLELSRPIEVRGELSYKEYTPDLDACLEKARQNRPELRQLRFQKKMAGEMVKVTRSAALPSLAVSANYNFWADAFNFQRDTWQNYYTVNLVLSIPVFDGFATSARVARSKAMIRELELTHKGLIDMVEFEVRQAILNLREARESLLSQEKNVEQAQESLRIAELNFQEGLATTLDVSSAQAALTQAKTNYTQALFDYVMSLAQLNKAMGIGDEIDNMS